MIHVPLNSSRWFSPNYYKRLLLPAAAATVRLRCFMFRVRRARARARSYEPRRIKIRITIFMTGLHVNRSTIYVEINIASRSSTFSLRRVWETSHRESVLTRRTGIYRQAR